jgi:hypothetical protein
MIVSPDEFEGWTENELEMRDGMNESNNMRRTSSDHGHSIAVLLCASRVPGAGPIE